MIKDRLSDPFFDMKKSEYFRSSDPMMNMVNLPVGYLAIEGEKGLYYVFFNKLEPDELSSKLIPKELHYPQRKTGPILMVCLCVYVLLSKLILNKEDLPAESVPGKGMRFFIWVFTGGFALAYMPFFYGWIHDSPPFVFMGGFIAICGIIGLAMFGYQYVFTNNLIEKKKGLLAHWSFFPEEWNNFTEKEYKTEQTEKKGLLSFHFSYHFNCGRRILVSC